MTERKHQWIAAALVAGHLLLILARMLPRTTVPERFRALAQ